MQEMGDIVFKRAMARMRLASKYSIAANKLPLKPLIKDRYRGKKIPLAVDIRVTLRDAALKKKMVRITYKKTTNGEVKIYQIEPYSLRYIRMKVGVRKSLFGFDIKEDRIKSFAMRNITRIEMTNSSFSPRWPIEIAKRMRNTRTKKLGK